MLNESVSPQDTYKTLISHLVYATLKGLDISSMLTDAEKSMRHDGETKREIDDIMCRVVHDTFVCVMRFHNILLGEEGEEAKQRLEQGLEEHKPIEGE